MQSDQGKAAGLVAALRASEALLSSALDAVSQGSLVTDSARNTIYCSRTFSELTGYDIADMMGKNCSILQGPDTDPDTIEDIRRAITAGRRYRGRILNYRRDGTKFWNHLTINPIRNSRGEIDYFVSEQRDVTADVETALHVQSSHDEVTGLPSRITTLGSLNDILDEAHATGTQVALGVIDIEGFTAINHDLGRVVGDQVLREVAARLSSRSRAEDKLTRLGGGQFLVIVRNLDGRPGSVRLEKITTHLIGASLEPVSIPQQRSIPITLNYGFSVWPRHAQEGNDL